MLHSPARPLNLRWPVRNTLPAVWTWPGYQHQLVNVTLLSLPPHLQWWEYLSRICLSCSLSNHNAHALTWFHWSLIELTCTSSSVITLSIKAPATVHSPSDLVNVLYYVDSTPAYTKAEYLPCLLTCISLPPVSLLVFSSPTRSSVSVISVLLLCFPHRSCPSYLWMRRHSVTCQPSIRTISDDIHSPVVSIAHPV